MICCQLYTDPTSYQCQLIVSACNLGVARGRGEFSVVLEAKLHINSVASILGLARILMIVQESVRWLAWVVAIYM